MKYLDKYPNCIGCPVKKWCGTMISCLRLCKSYQNNKEETKMNYEQKYKEAIERCKSWIRGEHPECFTEAQKAGEFIFPELKESEDERIRNAIKEAVDYYWSDDTQARTNIFSWLEKQGEKKSGEIRGNFGGISSNWSEKDEHYKNGLIGLVEDSKAGLPINLKGEAADKCIDWLKSIKPNHWKPSEFQLECLKKVIPHNNTEKDCELEDVLTELYNDLKNL